MTRRLGWILLFAPLLMAQADKPERRTRVDVESYVVDANINPRTQSLTGKAKITFKALDDNLTSATFELHNNLNVVSVTDESGAEIGTTRLQADYSIRLALPSAMAKGSSKTLTISYEGRLTGTEESPVYGIKFAAIKEDFSYLMYPARWFPVNDYTVDRYVSEWHLTVPTGYKVVGGGFSTTADAADGVTYTYKYTTPNLVGSFAVVKGEPQRTSVKGVTTAFYLRAHPDYAPGYGDEISNLLTYFGSIYGLPPSSALTVVETEAGAPNGYSSPGLLFLAPGAMTQDPPKRLLANMIARQWWGNLITVTSRNHLWLINGWAKYSEALYLEHEGGAAVIDGEMKDIYVDALSVNEAPLIQASRFEDYSPEYWASTASKGAAVLHMLRYIMGDKPFEQAVKKFADQSANKAVNTEMFKKAAEAASNKNFQNFFVQWIESTGAPEFKLEYVVYRTDKGFRIMGKISQDLDTFRMPVDLDIQTEGNPERKSVEVVGTSSEFFIETFGKPKKVVIDPDGKVLRFSPQMRVAVSIRRGEQLVEVGEMTEALKEYQKALDVQRTSSLAHYRIAEVFFQQSNLQSAANEFRESLNGDLEPKWVEVWSHINLGKVFDITGQRDRAVNEYQLAVRTKDNTQGAQLEAAKLLKDPYKRPVAADQ